MALPAMPIKTFAMKGRVNRWIVNAKDSFVRNNFYPHVLDAVMIHTVIKCQHVPSFKEILPLAMHITMMASRTLWWCT